LIAIVSLQDSDLHARWEAGAGLVRRLLAMLAEKRIADYAHRAVVSATPFVVVNIMREFVNFALWRYFPNVPL
jgi:hypothetical protein